MIKDKNLPGFPAKGDTPSEEGNSRFDIEQLPEEYREFAKEKLSGDETNQDVIEKLFKMASASEQKISTQGKEISDLNAEYKKFAVATGAGLGSPTPPEEKPVSEEERVVNLEQREAALVQKYADSEKRLDVYDQKLAQMDALHRGDVSERAAEKLERGRVNLVEKVGLELADQYFNPSDIPNSPVGQLLNPDVNPDCGMFWRTQDPVWSAFKFLASVEEVQKIEVPLKPAPTERAGTSALPGEVSEDYAMKKAFFESAGVDIDKLKKT